MSRILPLPPDAIAQIHSTKHITSLQHVVLALLENSLDAQATKVQIRVDFRRGACAVEDNGSGILSCEFEEDGGLLKMHCSSKCNVNRDLHGSTGTYLASLGALSLLSITSQHSAEPTSGTITLHNGRTIERRVSEALGLDSHWPSRHGTQVTVRDLFGNMPVRVRQRALSGDADPKDERAWHDLKRGLVALLLAWPTPCAIWIRDCNQASKTLHISPHHPSVSGLLTAKHLHRLAGKAIKADIKDSLPVVFQAGLAAAETRFDWVAVRASSGNLSVKGLVCLTPAPTRQCQFVSIGVHPCSPASGYNALFDIINKTFANSSFGATHGDPHAFDKAETLRRRSDRRYKNDGYTQKQLRNQRGVDHCPMFVLQLELKEGPRHHILADIIGGAHLKLMVDLLEATMLQWLTANHFRPRKCRKLKHDEQQGPSSAASAPSQPSSAVPQSTYDAGASGALTPLQERATIAESVTTSKRRRTTEKFEQNITLLNPSRRPATSHHAGLSRIKSGDHDFFGEAWDGIRHSRSVTTALRRPVVGREESGEGDSASTRGSPTAQKTTETQIQDTVLPSTRLSSDDFGSVDEDVLLTATQAIQGTEASTSQAQQDRIVEWTDPVTNQSYRINSRTGVVLPVQTTPKAVSGDASVADATRQTAAINTALTSTGRPLSLARRADLPESSSNSSWLPGFLKDWNNPVFIRQDEERIPVTSFDGPGIDLAELGRHRCTEHVVHERFAEIGTRVTGQLSKEQLRHMKVIWQVDQKFILCTVQSRSSSLDGETLILVDQHAASERVILEELLQELCAPLSPSDPVSALTTKSGHRSSLQTIALERPQHFQISGLESELFEKHGSHFARWGFLYNLSQRASKPTASQLRRPNQNHIISVLALPPGISERCTLSPNLLIELLRSELWSIASGTTRPAVLPLDSERNSNDDDEHSWLRHVGSCPKGVLDMLNSRACRSAIMFNDVLTKQQCEELVDRLARCAFPFMCAHGRVSMVPVVELGAMSGWDGGFADAHKQLRGQEDGRQMQSFSSQFREWCGRDANHV